MQIRLGENHEEDYRYLLHYILMKCHFIMSSLVVFIYIATVHMNKSCLILFLSLPFASVTKTTCIKSKAGHHKADKCDLIHEIYES